MIEPQQYITDTEGHRIAVVLDLKDYQQLIEAWEDIHDEHTYDVRKAALAKDEIVPLDQAIVELEEQWKSGEAE